MLSEEQIVSLIARYANTSTGKKEIAKHKKGKFVPFIASDDKQKSSLKQLTNIALDLKQILYKHIYKVIKSFDENDIIVGKPKWVGVGYYISIRFNEAALHRPSLDPDLYPEGISNIIRLFVNGYKARGSVYGVWQGHGDEAIWSLNHREPNNFLNNAVSEFNDKYKEIAHAELKNAYKNDI